MKKIVYAGTPEFAVEILKFLHTSFESELIAVLSRPDAKTGRGKKLLPSEVKHYCQENNLQIHTPINKDECLHTIQGLNPDLILVAAYGIILPKEIVNNYLCVNVHGSLLPHYRGASPIQASLLNRDKETGITLFKMNERMDEGDIYLKKETPINEKDTFKSLHDKLIDCSIDELKIFMRQFMDDCLAQPSIQNHSKASYCSKIKKEDTFINSHDSITTVMGKIKAFSPKPGAIFPLKSGKRIKIIDATIEEEKLIPLLVQPEGKKVMSYKDYCLGSNEKINLG